MDEIRKPAAVFSEEGLRIFMEVLVGLREPKELPIGTEDEESDVVDKIVSEYYSKSKPTRKKGKKGSTKLKREAIKELINKEGEVHISKAREYLRFKFGQDIQMNYIYSLLKELIDGGEIVRVQTGVYAPASSVREDTGNGEA